MKPEFIILAILATIFSTYLGTVLAKRQKPKAKTNLKPTPKKRIMPTKEQRKESVAVGYDLGVYYRLKFIAWIKRILRLKIDK